MTSDGEIQAQRNSASFYNKRYSNNGLNYHKAIIFEMMKNIPFSVYPDSSRILDVGCGTGIISSVFPDHNITGIDVSEDMLALNPYKWIKASVTKIPFEDNYFQHVLCRSVLHHLDSPRLAMAEIKRVLKPGGHFVCWETNKGWLAHMVRKATQHGDRFNEYHGNLGGIPTLIDDYLDVSNVKYGGFFAYLLCGFPDILEFPDNLTCHWKALMELDEQIPQALMKQIGFYVMVKATK